MTFCFETIVRAPRETVFRFFANPGNLNLLHNGWSRVRVLKHCEFVKPGAETWVEVMVAGFIPMVLGFRHGMFEPPIRFAEKSIHGIFSRFEHRHEFIASGKNTIIRDLLDVQLPWYYGGEAFMRKSAAPQIEKMFQGRSKALTRLADSGVFESVFSPSHHGKDC